MGNLRQCIACTAAAAATIAAALIGIGGAIPITQAFLIPGKLSSPTSGVRIRNHPHEVRIIQILQAVSPSGGDDGLKSSAFKEEEGVLREMAER